MPSQTRSPGSVRTGNTFAGDGQSKWVNLDNIKVDDTNYAVSSEFDGGSIYGTNDIIPYNFGFTIPPNSVINGIMVEEKLSASTDNVIYFDSGVLLDINGDTVGAGRTPSDSLVTAPERYYQRGHSGDTWGTTWDYSKINNSNFGFKTYYFAFDVNLAILYNHIRITVYYTEYTPAAIPLPSGATILWFGTNATIPVGFTRDTAFDGKYLLACHSGHTSGGTTGGQASHTHNIAGHTHAISSDMSTSKDGVSTLGIGDSSSLSGHSHSSSNLVLSLSAVTLATNNTPPNVTAIFITSNGIVDVPASGVGFFETGSTGLFVDYTNPRGYYIKGAATDGNGGTFTGDDTHNHTMANHNHPASTSAPGDTRGADVTATRANTVNTHDHTHAITVFTAVTTLLSASLEPTYKTLNSIINGSTGSTPAINGFIAIWKGKKSDIPANWSEYKAHRDCFLRVWSGNTAFVASGGARTHMHSSSGKHIHTFTVGAGTAGLTQTGVITGVALNAHTHTWTLDVTGSDSNSSTNDANYPPYINAYLIKYTDPTTVTLATISSII